MVSIAWVETLAAAPWRPALKTGLLSPVTVTDSVRP
jgi:hypothetical protein